MSAWLCFCLMLVGAFFALRYLRSALHGHRTNRSYYFGITVGIVGAVLLTAAYIGEEVLPRTSAVISTVSLIALILFFIVAPLFIVKGLVDTVRSNRLPDPPK